MSQSDRQSAQNRPLALLAQQLDLDGRLHDIAPGSERLPLFEHQPQIDGQTFMDVDPEPA